EAPVNIPVHVAQIVAALIAAVIREFQAEALARSGVLALRPGPGQPLGDQVKPLELAQELGVEERLGSRVRCLALAKLDRFSFTRAILVAAPKAPDGTGSQP